MVAIQPGPAGPLHDLDIDAIRKREKDIPLLKTQLRQIERHLFLDLPSNRYAQISNTGAGHLPALRHPVHNRPSLEAIRADLPHHHEPVAAQQAHRRQPRSAVALGMMVCG